MASYIVLFQFTEQGVRNVKDSPKRAVAAAETANKIGVKVTDMFWTMGAYDGVLLADAPNDEAMTAFALSVAALGNIKTQTLPAFRAREFDTILKKMA